MSFSTPDLPYAYNALEPYIDEQTMKFHHDKHHVGYTTKLNAAIEGTELVDKTPGEIIKDVNSLPESIREAVRNNGGGHINHCLFWQIMSPSGGGQPEGHLAAAMDKVFGNFDSFVKEFSTVAATRFGSGWAWLVLDGSSNLKIVSTPNQNNPLTDGMQPILGIDVWEHAYYLKYQNRRPEYIENFFKVVNWPKVAEYYEKYLG